MNVYRLAHAGLLVEAGALRCLIDPVLIDPFECGWNRFEPPVRIDPSGLEDRYDVIVLSHEHMDHFCVRSLSLLDRSRPVVFPVGCVLIEHALTRLGFRTLVQVRPGETVPVRGAELTFTPSDVTFPEMGVLFSAAGEHVWNCVDTEIGERALSLVASRAGRVDVMLAQYQALVEEELGVDALGASFPYAVYSARLRAVIEANPRCVVPSSCGYRYSSESWQNHRGFPVTEEEFLADVHAIRPNIAGIRLPPGAVLNTTDLGVQEKALPFVQPLEPSQLDVLEWRPDLGVPFLRDDDPYCHGTEVLRRNIGLVLDGEFLVALTHAHLRDWQTRLAAAGVVWQLDLVYPDGTVDQRWLDFAEPVPRWLQRAPRAPKIVTSVCASTVAGLQSGEVTIYRAIMTRRVALKLYVPSIRGVERVGTVADDPLARVMFPGANRRYINAELDRLVHHRHAAAGGQG